MPKQVITIKRAHWRIPSVGRAFDGYLVGKPTAEEKKGKIEQAKKDREAWKPIDKAWKQLEEVKLSINHNVIIQIWDPMMFMLGDEGPYPIKACCINVVTHPDADGFIQAYMKLKNVECIETENGYDGLGRLEESHDDDTYTLNLGQIYEIEIIQET